MHRADAAVPPSRAARMTELVRDWTVAVITGRAVDDAAARLNCDPHYLFGNHGAEFHGAGRVWPASFSEMSGAQSVALFGALLRTFVAMGTAV